MFATSVSQDFSINCLSIGPCLSISSSIHQVNTSIIISSISIYS